MLKVVSGRFLLIRILAIILVSFVFASGRDTISVSSIAHLDTASEMIYYFWSALISWGKAELNV